MDNEEKASEIILKHLKDMTEESHKMMCDELIWGVSISETKEGIPRRVDPLSEEGMTLLYNQTHSDSKGSFEHLTLEEVIERYGDDLTEEQIKNLRNG